MSPVLLRPVTPSRGGCDQPWLSGHAPRTRPPQRGVSRRGTPRASPLLRSRQAPARPGLTGRRARPSPARPGEGKGPSRRGPARPAEARPGGRWQQEPAALRQLVAEVEKGVRKGKAPAGRLCPPPRHRAARVSEGGDLPSERVSGPLSLRGPEMEGHRSKAFSPSHLRSLPPAPWQHLKLTQRTY